MRTFLWIVSVMMVIAGLAGVVLPLLPGVPIIFAGLLAAAWLDGFQKVGWPTLVFLGLLTLISFIVDVAASGLGVRKAAASRAAIWGAAAGALVGMFFGIPGLLIGPFIGAAAAEFRKVRSLSQAGRAGLGAWAGLLFGTLIKLGLGFSMIGIFVAAYFL